MMTSRQNNIILAIIESYIKTAEPVSSKLLEKSYFPGLSSATLRNEMNELEELGYLNQLHTSGGRVPTDKAYRVYVDNLVKGKQSEPTQGTKNKIRGAISEGGKDARRLNKTIADVVADLSDNAVVTSILESDDFYKIGLSSLFEFPEFHELNRAFNIADIFDHFDQMFNQFEEMFFGELDPMAMKVMIGRESGVRQVQDETVIVARYPLPEMQTGSITVIGPMRMDYERNLGLIQCVVDEFNKNFNNNHGRKKTI